MTQERMTQRNKQIKDSIKEKTKEKWHGKSMHGQFPSNLRQETGG
jgi:hypothetical protein